MKQYLVNMTNQELLDEIETLESQCFSTLSFPDESHGFQVREQLQEEIEIIKSIIKERNTKSILHENKS